MASVQAKLADERAKLVAWAGINEVRPILQGWVPTGFEKIGPAAYWRQEAAKSQNPLPKLAALMKLVPVVVDGAYMWPAVATATATAADWEALKTVYAPARVIRYRAEGYTGWRVTVDRDGQWRSFFHQD